MSKKKIMIVDDDPGFVQLITDYFKQQGYEVKSANDFEETLNTFRREKPKVLLLDFNMPMVTGERLLPVLQSIDPMIRVIVVSGVIEEDIEEKFRGLGYYAFFKKGDLFLEDLKAKVEEALGF